MLYQRLVRIPECWIPADQWLEIYKRKHEMMQKSKVD
jgi:hypothetical protein